MKKCGAIPLSPHVNPLPLIVKAGVTYAARGLGGLKEEMYKKIFLRRKLLKKKSS
jgi:hypothetical protein